MSTEPQLVCAELLRHGADGWTLLGVRCADCGEVFFPVVEGCTRCCGQRLEVCDLGDRGVLWSWTIQGFLPKSPYDSGETEATFKPYGLGYVEMPCGLKVESRLSTADAQQLRIGMPVHLVLQPYRQLAGEAPLYTYAFAPDEVSP